MEGIGIFRRPYVEIISQMNTRGVTKRLATDIRLEKTGRWISSGTRLRNDGWRFQVFIQLVTFNGNPAAVMYWYGEQESQYAIQVRDIKAMGMLLDREGFQEVDVFLNEKLNSAYGMVFGTSGKDVLKGLPEVSFQFRHVTAAGGHDEQC